MDPFYYIHLKEVGEDIRGSHIAIYIHHDQSSKSTSVVAVNFQDRRWTHFINTPFSSVREELRIAKLQPDPLCAHVAYLNNLIMWWNDVLYTFNRELIAEENSLQNDLEISASSKQASSSANINKKLHTMAAHLYRYGSELDRIDKIASELKSIHAKLRPFENTEPSRTFDEVMEWRRVDQGLEQIISQMTALRSFREELERKTSNILALLFNNMQVLNDQRMQGILKATQEDTRRSQELAMSMKEDSIAMKTIALLTMFFLPGTSFAAILSMPFFTSSAYVSDLKRFWIWVVLTVPSTAVGLYVYVHVMRRKKRELGLYNADPESPTVKSHKKSMDSMSAGKQS
ncbi:uncharacterized protein BDZ99DRAFT_429058 [Mytilinidion resinicola]|uniref:Uncharacterized protein n=1 Tax=Mytilinidion resinicola TaxID=574789 RepID=A0A6A6Y1R9_9PEZI|nr:uncharacterized protein BDZ99DRAFT_429058 [Mytilinidion resinicola]KAF2802175.1 hypothetical protein BDZ99DRAFT_429058 [Mytilinidion resinicola]